jgi:predicted PurR-regulated permease PerM
MLLLSVLTSFFLYRDGEFVAQQMRTALTRIGGQRAERMLNIAGDTVRSVIYGVIGTALAQATLAGLGFWVAGVPGPILLALLTFLLSPLPMGSPIVWGGATIWLLNEGDYVTAVGMVIWGAFFVSTIDNVLRPIIIGAGSSLPFMLVLLGVVGGLLGFGLIGLFLGPTLLALGHNLLREWTHSAPGMRVAEGPAPAGAQAAAAAGRAAPVIPTATGDPGAAPPGPRASNAIPDPGHDTEEPS